MLAIRMADYYGKQYFICYVSKNRLAQSTSAPPLTSTAVRSLFVGLTGCCCVLLNIHFLGFLYHDVTYCFCTAGGCSTIIPVSSYSWFGEKNVHNMMHEVIQGLSSSGLQIFS